MNKKNCFRKVLIGIGEDFKNNSEKILRSFIAFIIMFMILSVITKLVFNIPSWLKTSLCYSIFMLLGITIVELGYEMDIDYKTILIFLLSIFLISVFIFGVLLNYSDPFMYTFKFVIFPIFCGIFIEAIINMD